MKHHIQKALFWGPDKPITVENCDLPSLREGEILVRITACALCRSDLHTYAGRRKEPTPTILGHEIVGHIEAFGPGAPHTDARGLPLEVGSRVTWAIIVACGNCFYCRENLPQKCEYLFKYGHSEVTEDDPLSGGLATHIVLRANTATYRVPEQMSNRVAALANCSTSTAAAVIRSAGSLKNRTVLIFGAGVLGLAATAMASTSLAAQTWVCDPVQANAERACSFGATSFAPADPQALREWVGQRTDGRGVDVAFELSGSLSATTQALECCRIGGKVILAGTASPVGTLQLDPETIVRRILTVQGAHNYHPSDLGIALDFLSGPGRAFPFEALFAGAYPLARVGEAFRAAERQPGLRIIVEPS